MRLCKQPEEIWLAVDIANVNIIGPEIATRKGFQGKNRWPLQMRLSTSAEAAIIIYLLKIIYCTFIFIDVIVNFIMRTQYLLLAHKVVIEMFQVQVQLPN